MKFSDNGYYLEEYVNCDNCGVLIYGSPIKISIDDEARKYCSDWCIDWDLKRQSERLDPDPKPDPKSAAKDR